MNGKVWEETSSSFTVTEIKFVLAQVSITDSHTSTKW